jgi:hypothetical protein
MLDQFLEKTDNSSLAPVETKVPADLLIHDPGPVASNTNKPAASN